MAVRPAIDEATNNLGAENCDSHTAQTSRCSSSGTASLQYENTSAEEFVRNEHAKHVKQSIAEEELFKQEHVDTDNSSNISTDTTEGADPPDLDTEFDLDVCHDIKANHTQSVSRPETLEIAAKDKITSESGEKPFIPGVMPLYVEGNLIKDGDMVSFVATNLEERIRLSSPVSKEELSTPPSGWSVPSSIYSSYTNSPTRQYHAEYLPPIDSTALTDIETQSYKIADSLHLIMGSLSSQLHNMSALTVGCLQTYRDMIHATSDNIDSSIKSMYALMAKCEELSKEMEPVYKLQDDIKEINRLLDVFENKIETYPTNILKH